MGSEDIVSAVRWFRRLRRSAPRWIGAFALVALWAAAEQGEAITLEPDDILIAQPSDASIIHVDPATGTQSLVVSGNPLVSPVGIAIAADNTLFVVDSQCCGGSGGVIRVNPVTGHQTVLSPPPGGNSPNYLNIPSGIAIAANGDLFVISIGPDRVVRVNPATGHQTVVSPVNGEKNFFNIPIAIAIAGPVGDLFVLDQGCCDGLQGGVIRVDRATGHQTVLSPPSGSSSDNLIVPFGIVASATTGELFVSARSCCPNGGVVQVNLVDGKQTVVAPTASSENFLDVPAGIASALNGDLLVADHACCGGKGGVIRVNPATGHQTQVSPRPGQENLFDRPMGIAVVTAVVPPGPPPLGSCGGSVPCACGDRVVSDRTLRGTDPVTRNACPADGLVVATGVTLDLGGATLRGQGAGAGVRVEAGATDVAIRRGKVSGFATGVRGEGTTRVRVTNVQVVDNAQDGVNVTGDGHAVETAVAQGNGGFGVTVVGTGGQLSRLQVRHNGRAGVRLIGSGHTVAQSAIENNGDAGAEVSGDGNQVTLLQLEGNGGDGAFVTGTGNRAARNVVTRNGGAGLAIQGEHAAVEANRATRNGEAGLEIRGTGHAVSLNEGSLNGGTGLEMLGTADSRFDRNRGTNNRGFGMADDSTGTGTAGTANTYIRNICGRGNAAGVSSPAGLCR